MAQVLSQADATLSLETSHPTSLSHASSHRVDSSSFRTPLSIYVTFKVVRLVSAFRRRARAKNQPVSDGAFGKEAFCQEFERQAFEQIDQYLGRRTVYPRAKQHCGKAPTRHKRLDTRSSREDRISHGNICLLLDQIYTAGKSHDLNLTSIASDNQLFLQRQSYFEIRRLCPHDIFKLVIAVRNLLDTLEWARSSPRVQQDESLDPSIDHTYIANLEHLLLCLQGQLLRLVVEQLVEQLRQHVRDCQRNQDLHCNEHITEFPSAKRPLSTTWPWSIRPSLAVLWGVCWMFYDSSLRFDSEGNMTDVLGNVIVPHHAVNQYLAAMRQQQRQQAPASRGPFRPSAFFGGDSQNQRNTNNGHHHRQQQNRSAYGDALSPYDNAATAPPVTFPHQWAQQQQQHDSAAAAPVPGLSYPDQNIWLAHAQQSHAQDSNSVPDEPGLSYAPSHSILPPRSRATPTQPIIRITPDWNQDFSVSQPQDDAYSAVPTSSSSPLNSYNHFSAANMSLPYPMPQDPDTMQTPVSPVSADNQPHEHTMGDEQQVSRKRSHSVMSQQDASLMQPIHQQQHHSRSGSIASAGASPNGITDDFSPRGSRAFKRGEPPTNAMGKYICTFASECEGQIFERKCEWSKHMDKHDRPYRCPHPQCAKLQGFTYSGGLLRHEREVHGKHGGPKSQLMCPHPDCKRHTGKGFTRKENLNEHLRRVHPGDKDSQNSILTQTATDGLLADGGEAPIAKVDEPVEHNDYAAPSPAKRKRSLPANIDGVLIEDSEREIKRLRSELAHRDQLIQQYQQESFQWEETKRQLYDLQQQMQHQEHHQHQQPQAQMQALPPNPA